ncbi:MAG: hypothetical protein IPI87_01085 [Betaproteobacteria bacterium]|nr:hypothetical protein [Betaproteobacteria bacterium]
MSLVKTGPATGVAGARFQWKLVIANAGPSAADGATFLDTLPDGTTVTEATCGEATGGAVCGAVAFDPATVTGTITTLPAQGSVTITVTASRTTVGDATNTATVSPPTGTVDPDPSNDTGTATIRIERLPGPSAVPTLSAPALLVLMLALMGAVAMRRRVRA